MGEIILAIGILILMTLVCVPLAIWVTLGIIKDYKELKGNK